MPDATNTVKVDGVEPSILVRFLDEPDAPERVRLRPADDGTERFLVKGGKLWLVDRDFEGLGVIPYEVVERKSISDPVGPSSGPIPAAEPVKATMPGQSGQ